MNLPPVQAAIDSLEKNGVNYELYDKVRIEPTDARWIQGSTFGPVTPYIEWELAKDFLRFEIHD